VAELRRDFPLKDLLKLVGMPRSSFYYLIAEKVNKNADVKEKIEEIYHQHRGRYGYRRITQELRNQGLIINHKFAVSKPNQKMGDGHHGIRVIWAKNLHFVDY